MMLAEAVHGALLRRRHARRWSRPPSGRRALAERARAAARAFFAAMAQGDGAGRRRRRASGRGRGPRGGRDPRALDELRDDPRLLAGPRSARCCCARPRPAAALIDRGVSSAPARRSRSACCRSLLHHLARDQATTDRWAGGRGRATTRRSGWRGRPASASSSRRRSPGSPGCEARQGREERVPRARRRGASSCATSSASAVYGVWAHAGARRPRARARAAPASRSSTTRRRPRRCARARHRRRRPLARARAGGRLPAARAARDDARRAAGELRRARPRPRASRGRWPGAARCRGLLAGDGGRSSALFEEALALHAQHARRLRDRPHPAGLRRAPAPRTPARPRPRAAARGARGVRAARRAAVGRAGRAPSSRPPARPPAGATPSTLDELTPQELQIARLLADGRTTREAAAAIFLSPKTVEYHLRHVYRKLGIRSREELAARFAGGGAVVA